VIAAVFSDRDGTLNRKADEGDYVSRPDDVALLPGVAAAVRRLNDAGIPIIVVTNQRGVARGVMTEADYEAVAKRLEELLAAESAHIDATYVCPHDLDSCDCRKPAPGLLLKAISERPAIRPEAAVMIGDSATDVGAGRGAGVRTVRIAAAADPEADFTAPDFPAAVEWVLERAGQ
jgi:D-glycero-D-manno-heptose 1,7-bisphosphate phosphatase